MSEHFENEVVELRAKLAELERVVVLSNDAMCAITHLLCRIVVNADIAMREEIADAIMARAAPVDRDDHNPLLLAFARTIRMNYPGGRFDMIEGGRTSPVDPGAD